MKFTITNSSGALISGASVTIGAATVVTDATGSAEFAGLTNGTSYTAFIKAAGYSSNSVAFTDTETPQTVALTTSTAAVVANVASEALVAGDAYVTALLAKIDAKIASSHSWSKAGWIVLRALVEAGQSWAIKTAASKLL